MMFKLLSKLMGRNIAVTPKSVILDQLNEPRPLPVGMTEWEEWANRIISGAMLPADVDSLKFTLASMILAMKPTESVAPDAYFIHGLRKAAANQIAYAKQVECHKKAKERLAAEEAKVTTVGSGGTLTLVKDETILDNKEV